ncbi:hypothetical protein [Paenibacillus silvisoli]|uniref:hypothetical protein n=1 Tax=Paenibacillus silvisoli TaxID=3110539 RepID=UPI002805EEB5|nr:hypothetical protein [Paenibacillus silvisoli]
MMNKHDQARKDALVKTLCKAKEQAETAKLYLVTNDRDADDVAAAALALEHVEIALEHLGALVPSA